MTVFRGVGDAAQLLALLALNVCCHDTNTLTAVSFAAQQLRILASIARLVDHVLHVSVRVLHILTGLLALRIAFLLWRSHRADKFRIGPVILGCAALAFLVHYEYVVVEILFAFATYVEAVALVPQVLLTFELQRQPLPALYLFFLASYHIFLTVDWIVRWYQNDHLDYIATFASCVQNLVYVALCSLHVSAIQAIKADTTRLELVSTSM